MNDSVYWRHENILQNCNDTVILYKVIGVSISMFIICVKCCPFLCRSCFLFLLYSASTAAVCSVLPSGLCQGGKMKSLIERQGPTA